MNIIYIGQLIVLSILLGLIYVCMAVGLNIIYGVMKMVNWAHGAFVMLGAYIAYWLFVLYGIYPYIGAIIAAAIISMLGLAVHELALRPIFKAKYFRAMALIITYGLSILLINVARVLWTDVLRGVSLKEPPFNISGISISRPYLYGGLFAFISSIILYVVLKKTYIGKAIRATSQDSPVAMLMGINTEFISRFTFMVGSALAGLTGGLLCTIFAVTPEMGSVLGVKAVTIVVLGGLGSYIGALVGGLLLGFAEVIGTYLLGARYQPLFYFLTLVLILLFKPTGIAGEAE